MHLRHLLVATSIMACGGGATAHGTLERSDEEGSTFERVSDHETENGSVAAADVPYDRAIQKSVHNAYERDEPLLDQLVYHRVRSLELDVHTRREGASAPARDWFVYHEDYPGLRGTTCLQLSDCLGQIA
ncbi:MAG: hypothetical protein K0S65_2029, partial [Labilithrix sp.]|nr:hypothetical protein [Labilithrix sp.]